MSSLTLEKTLYEATIQLLALGLGKESAFHDAFSLIGHALNLKQDDLLDQMNRLLTDEELGRLQKLLERRLKRETIARILGEKEFMGLRFGLNEATLEPRPESELIVNTAARYLRIKTWRWQLNPRHLFAPLPSFHVLDLGTGSGCLLLSVLHIFHNAFGFGIDLAPRAVEQARQNAEHLNLNNKATFKVNNWLNGINERFDVIIANPPYIKRNVIPDLMSAVRNYDPLLALDGGEDGLDAYRTLVPQLPSHLKKGGLAVFEIGHGQGKDVTALLRQAGFIKLKTRRDNKGYERCVTAIWKG